MSQESEVISYTRDNLRDVNGDNLAIILDFELVQESSSFEGIVNRLYGNKVLSRIGQRAIKGFQEIEADDETEVPIVVDAASKQFAYGALHMTLAVRLAAQPPKNGLNTPIKHSELMRQGFSILGKNIDAMELVNILCDEVNDIQSEDEEKNDLERILNDYPGLYHVAEEIASQYLNEYNKPAELETYVRVCLGAIKVIKILDSLFETSVTMLEDLEKEERKQKELVREWKEFLDQLEVVK